MFIERFFNPVVYINDCVYYNTKEALEHCQKYYSCIAHYSFGDKYIKYNGENFIWNDGSKVDTQKLPNDNGWGKYFSKIHNFCSF